MSTTTTISNDAIFSVARRAFDWALRIALEERVIDGSSESLVRLLTTRHDATWQCKIEAGTRAELYLRLCRLARARGR